MDPDTSADASTSTVTEGLELSSEDVRSLVIIALAVLRPITVPFLKVVIDQESKKYLKSASKYIKVVGETIVDKSAKLDKKPDKCVCAFFFYKKKIPFAKFHTIIRSRGCSGSIYIHRNTRSTSTCS